MVFIGAFYDKHEWNTYYRMARSWSLIYLVYACSFILPDAFSRDFF